MKKTFLLFAALIIGATSANAQRFISTDAMTTKDKEVVKETVAKPFKQQITNSAKDFTYGPAVMTVSFDDATQYVMENLPGHTAGTGPGMFHRFDTSATSTTAIQSTFPNFYSFFAIGTYGYYHVGRYVGYGDPSGYLIGDGFALISPRDVFQADGTNTKAYNTVVRLTEPIQTTGFNTVDVVFNQYTMRFNQDRYFIDYSTDANFATYDSIEFNVKGLELGSNDLTRGQKIVTLPVANTVDQSALYIRFRYKCNILTTLNLPSGYRWIIDEINVYDGPEYRINVVSTNHNYAAYGVIPSGMQIDTMDFVAVVENTGGNTLFNASAQERYHNATNYVFPNEFTSFLDYTSSSLIPQNITTATWNDSVRNSAGTLTGVDKRRHVEIEARGRQYNAAAGLHGISSGIKYLESPDSTTYRTIPMEDSIYYRVSQMPSENDPIGTARWASDVDVLIEGMAWAYGFEGGYISEVAPGSAVAGYEVCNRFVTPSDLGNDVFAKGVEIVPAADSCDAGLAIQVSLKYLDFSAASADEYIKPYVLTGTTTEVLSEVITIDAESLNNGIFTNEDATEWTSTYNSIYVPFIQENVVLQPDQWYYACYKLLDDGRFLVARDDKDYLPTFKTVDWNSKLVMTPGEESEGYAWGYFFGDWFSNNSQPMIRLMVSPNPLSIKDINNVASFNLNAYPNPAQNETTIEYTLTSNSNVVITVSDIMGREIVRMNEGTKTANSINRVALNTANMNNGTYFYTINVNGVKETKKLVVNK